jgi:hypothetical protein
VHAKQCPRGARQDRQETIVQEPHTSCDRELLELEFKLEFSRADFPAANGTYCRWMAHRFQDSWIH